MSTTTTTQLSGAKNWGHANDANGPDEWSKHYPTGKRQSPINILVNNCERLTHSTCCCGCVQPTRYSEQSSSIHVARLPDRLRDRVYISADNRGLSAHGKQRRSHLDSIGEDHHRSSSTSSSASNLSSSPIQNNHSDSNSDDELDECSVARVGVNYNIQPARSASNRFINDADENNRRRHHQHTTKQVQNTRHCVTNKKIFLGYPRYLSTLQLSNTGHNWQVDLQPELTAHTLLSGPPLADREYRLAQFHCHWGEDSDHGSEHQINGKSFAAEIHFVHWNCTDFGSMEEAARHKHGLSVLAVLVRALDGEQNRNKHLEKIITGLKRVHKPGTSVAIHARLDLKKLFPANRWTYASYHGSLTTPPLSEVVDWVVFLDPIQCSTSQIEQFRQLRCSASFSADGQTNNNSSGGLHHQYLVKNCRPVQPLNNRTVSIWTHH